MLLRRLALLLLAWTGEALSVARGGLRFSPNGVTHRSAAVSMSGVWNSGLEYGKGLFTRYTGFDKWMEPFPAEDREMYPEMFVIPDGVYEVAVPKPLGIAFEEVANGCGAFVTELVEGGNAEASRKIKPGDKLIAVTAIKVIGAKWERRLIPVGPLDFDTILDAIGSNEPRWGCKDVIMQFERPGEADAKRVKEHLEFFEPPADSPWLRG